MFVTELSIIITISISVFQTILGGAGLRQAWLSKGEKLCLITDLIIDKKIINITVDFFPILPAIRVQINEDVKASSYICYLCNVLRI